MASFPTSVKTFTTKNTGDVIQATHVNDLQDETNAIEAGYLQGTARLNSSNSTVANLNVSGKSTFIDGIVVGGNSTFNNRPVMPAEAGVVYLDAIQDFGSSAISTVLFKAQVYLYRTAQHSTTSVGLYPLSSGLHHYSAQLQIGGVVTSTQYVQVDILDSSGTQVAIHRTEIASTGIAALTVRVDGYKIFDVVDGLGAGLSTQYCVCRCVMAGGASTVRASSGAGTTFFAMTRL